VAGADEAGRGSLAGPLVAAAVVFDYGRHGPGDRRFTGLGRLNDSKEHTAADREALYRIVLGAAEQVRVVARCAPSIDRRGLHRSNLDALREALCGLDPAPDLCVVDGFAVGSMETPCRRVVGGDHTSAAIAAASIVAKVVRDRYMRAIDGDYPGYGFVDHVGYSTPDHRAAIRRIGPSRLHRRSFASIAYRLAELGDDEAADAAIADLA
jgi:ribonuclease HII